MSVTLSTIGVVLVVLIICLIICVGFCFPICYATWVVWKANKPKIKTKEAPDLVYKNLTSKDLSPADRKRKRQEKFHEIVKRDAELLTPHIELVLKENGWIKGEDNLWSNKDYTNISFSEAVEEDSLSMLDDIITRRERAYKLHNIEKLKTILVKEEKQ